MLIVMKRNISEEQLRQIKQHLDQKDFDFHQSTGADRIIIGVIGDTRDIDPGEIKGLPGVHAVFKIPDEE